MDKGCIPQDWKWRTNIHQYLRKLKIKHRTADPQV